MASVQTETWMRDTDPAVRFVHAGYPQAWYVGEDPTAPADPTAITGLTATETGTRQVLNTWDQPTDLEPGDVVQLEDATAGHLVGEYAHDSTGRTSGSLTVGVTYSYRARKVKRRNGVDFPGPWSDVVTVTIAGTNSAGTTLWRPNLDDGVATFGYGVSALGPGCTATTPVYAGSPDPTGRVLAHTIASGVADDGVKGRSWLDTVGVAARDELYFSTSIMIPSTANIRAAVGASTTKQAWGVGGKPRTGNLWQVSAGGTKYADSWSYRFCTIPENYGNFMGNVHPFTFIMYLYARSAAGRTLQQYGIEVPFKVGTDYYEPTVDQWIDLTGRVKINTDGVADGVAEAWVGGTRWASVTDVEWNSPGYRQQINVLVNETFHNDADDNANVYRYADMELRSAL